MRLRIDAIDQLAARGIERKGVAARALLWWAAVGSSRWRKVAIGVALGAVVGLRFAVVASWHVPAGDGVQYYQLAQDAPVPLFATIPTCGTDGDIPPFGPLNNDSLGG